jgi:alpha-tubulin suppressor-like RCC1 family protein
MRPDSDRWTAALPRSLALLALLALCVACSGSSVVGGPADASTAPVDASLADDVACAPAQTRCGGRCVDLRADLGACGACGVSCGPLEACSSGVCVQTCPVGQILCGRLCVSTRTDRAHCGACGVRCGDAEVCAEGRCQLDCGPRLALCAGATGGDASVADAATASTCADTQYDPMNCGACGTQCPLTQVCSMGRCADRCPAGTVYCGGTCVDLQTNRNNCGSCGLGCPSGRPCVAGACDMTCGMGATRCGTQCTELSADPAHCGACGHACASGEVCASGSCAPMCPSTATNCSGSCRELASDNNHCGACGNACSAGQACAAGRCACTTGTGCAVGGVTTCVDTQSDPQHCGACGRACGAGTVCVRGACVDNCPAGLANCGGACRDVQTAASDCGACGVRCPAGQACAMGVCGRCPSGGTSCAGTCRDTTRDNANCGACGVTCASAEQCVGGRCVIACGDGLVTCGMIPFCIDLQTDVLHCGTCDTACPSGSICQGGSCRVSCLTGTTNCGGICRNLLSDNVSCGACGVACGPTEICTAGACAPRCRPGEVVCDRRCVSLLTDDANCGACGRSCTGGCVAGACALPEDVFAGYYEACARYTSGRVACWGLGTAVGAFGYPPVHVGDPRPVIGVMGAPVVVQSMTMGTYPEGGCGVDGGGDVVCWGGGYSTSSRKIMGARNAIQVSYGAGAGRSGCALRDDLRVVCWGSNTAGQRGIPGLTTVPSEPATVVPLANVRAIANGGTVICGLTTGAEVYCWGQNALGQRGVGTTAAQPTEPTRVPGLRDVRELWAGYDSVCARRADGVILCWGRNTSGELGLGDATNRASPTVVPAWAGATSLSMGANVTCAVLRGEVWCSGASADGALGLGSVTSTTSPLRVGTLAGQRQVHVGYSLTCALQESPRVVRCWGHDDYGQTGSHHEMLPTPTPVIGISDAIAVEAGYRHIAVLRRSGGVLTWGNPSGNNYGQLGTGSSATAQTPAAVVGIADAVQISSGYYHTCARRAGGTVACWGYNELGSLGVGSLANSNVPLPVVGLTGVVDIRAGGGHTCALLGDGTARCWGQNTYGQVGNNNTINQLTPVTVLNSNGTAPLTGIVQLSMQANASCARFADGTAKCWGRNVAYELANLVTTNSYLPTPVLGSPSTLSSAVPMTGIESLQCDAQVSGCTFLTATSYGLFASTGLATPYTGRSGVRSVRGGTALVITSANVLYNAHRSEYGLSGLGVYTNYAQPLEGCPGVTSYNPANCTNSRVAGGRTYVDGAALGDVGAWGLTGVMCAVRADGLVDCWGSTASGFMRALGIEPRVLTPGSPVSL